MEACVCASCPDVHQDKVAELCKKLQIQKAFGRAGDMVDSLSGTDWVAKWEAKVVMATVTKIETLEASKAKILCISGGKHCDLEMARQPKLVKAIRQELDQPNFPIKVEWMDFPLFLEEYADQGQAKPEQKVKENKGKSGQKGKGKKEKFTSVSKLEPDSSNVNLKVHQAQKPILL